MNSRAAPQDTTLTVLLYGEPALTIPPQGAALNDPNALKIHPAFERLSAAWDRTIDLPSLSFWLDAMLPENGARDPFLARAQQQRNAAGLDMRLNIPVDVLWGNTDAEYTGAVSFKRSGAPREAQAERRYIVLAGREVGDRLHEADRVAKQTARGPRHFPGTRSSLSGMRGKLGLTRLEEPETWGVALDPALNTWIAKHEDDPRNPGEAGIEAICQRTMAHLDIPAARTLSRVFGGIQAVLSERSDRYQDPETGYVLAHHQEELCQAWGWPPMLKYHQGPPAREPGWREAYQLLEAQALNPHAAQCHLTRVLVATWAIGHSDLHRRNLGIRHPLPGRPDGLEIAPLYDVASAVGIEQRYALELALPIANQRSCRQIGPRQWIEHAEQTGQDVELVLAVVSEIVADIPEALASARDQAADEDENHRQDVVDRRIDEMLAYASTRARLWRENIARMRSRGARGLRSEAAAIGEKLLALQDEHGTGTVGFEGPQTGPFTAVHTDPDGIRRAAGTVQDLRTAAEVLVHARRHPPEDIPFLERTLETEYQAQRQRTPPGPG